MEEAVKPENNNRRRKKVAGLVFICIALIGIITLYFYLHYKSTHITTDDAFIEGHIHTISAKVPGTVKMVYVENHQAVKKGDLLVEIDDVDYDVRLSEIGSGVNAERARLLENAGKVEVAKKQLSELKFRVDSAKANLELQEANLKQAEIDLKRARNLFEKSAIARDRFDRASTSYDVAAAQVKATREQLSQVQASIDTQKTMIKQAESAVQSQAAVVEQRESSLKAAELNRGYTKIYSPADGYVAKKSVEVGNQIQAAQPLMAVVPLDDIWVIANYKETQLEKVRPGQKVEIKADTYSGKVFYGRVESIMAGTGAAFSLFPPENATGNFVKVVQRIPVRILLDKESDREHVLRVGMSVVPTVIIEK
jgi:membrane fusion protein (multidrug efflux system)